MTILRKNIEVIVILSIAALNFFSCSVVDKLTNRDPVITRMYATFTQIYPGETTTVHVEADDPDGDLLSYSWTKDAGIFVTTDQNNSREWQAPVNPGNYNIYVTVRDENDGETSSKVTINVRSDLPATVNILQPEENESIPGIGSYDIKAEASHSTDDIFHVKFFIDDVLQSTLKTSNGATYTYSWNVENLSGQFELKAEAFLSEDDTNPGKDSLYVVVEGVTPFLK